MLGVLAVAVLLLGVWPAPLLDIMRRHASSTWSSQHHAKSKL